MIVFKLNPVGNSLLYSTLIGSTGNEFGVGVFANAAGEATVGGVILFGTNFPTTPGVVGPGTAPYTFDAFVARFNSTGSSLIYSTYLGNADPSSDEVWDLCVNSNNIAYVTGDGGSFSTFPVTSPCPACTGGEDIFVVKLNPTATSILWGTFVGSKDWDVAKAIAINKVNCNEEIAVGFGSS